MIYPRLLNKRLVTEAGVPGIALSRLLMPVVVLAGGTRMLLPSQWKVHWEVEDAVRNSAILSNAPALILLHLVGVSWTNCFHSSNFCLFVWDASLCSDHRIVAV